MGMGEPSIPTISSKTTKIGVYEDAFEAADDNYEAADDASGMLFPIHQTCLDILQRLCRIRQAQKQASDSRTPTTLEAFCDALRQRRWRNLADTNRPWTSNEGYYYAKSGGIEWPHGYYGARQFWADE